MKKRKTAAFLTAAAMALSMAASFPVSAADSVTVYAPGIKNMVNIAVKDKNGANVEGAELKLIDDQYRCIAKFTGNTDNGSAMNGSGLKSVPYDDSKNIIRTKAEDAYSYLPEGHRVVKTTSSNIISLSDGESETVDIYHCSDEGVPTDYVLSDGYIAIYTDAEYNAKKSDGYIEANGIKYGFKDSIDYPDNTAVYNVGALTEAAMFGIRNSVHSSAGSMSLDSSNGTTEYVKIRIPITDLSENFTGGTGYTIPAEDSGSGQAIPVDLLNDSTDNFASLIIVSGGFVSCVIPDSEGYIEFYADKETRRYTYHFSCSYVYPSGTSSITSTSHDDAGSYYYADMTQAVFICPNFPETGTSFINVPAGKYTIEEDSLPEGYSLSEPVEIEVTDTNNIQNFTVTLDDAVTEVPTEPVEGTTVYPKDNIVNITVKGYDGKEITDAKIVMEGTGVKASFDSGGKRFIKSGVNDITWYENGSEKKTMYIPFEKFKTAAGIEDSFGMTYEGGTNHRASMGGVEMNSGDTKKVTLYTKDDTVPADAVLTKGTMGLYTDPQWESNSELIGYLLVNNQPVYINAGDGSAAYGDIRYIDVGELTVPLYAGICESGVVPTSGFTLSTVAGLVISNEKAEYIKVRCHIREFSEDFAENGSILHSDLYFDPRHNTSSKKIIIFVVSGGMINAVIPDENGYIEFYADKKDRFSRMVYFATYSGEGFGGSFGADGTYIAADAYTANYTAVTLPDTGLVLSKVPAGEYTLTFSNISEDYRTPEPVSFTVEEKEGIQEVEIILQQGYTLGDVDDDGNIDINDAALVLSEYAGITAGLEPKFSKNELLAADINESGSADIDDAMKILEYYANKSAGLETPW